MAFCQQTRGEFFLLQAQNYYHNTIYMCINKNFIIEIMKYYSMYDLWDRDGTNESDINMRFSNFQILFISPVLLLFVVILIAYCRNKWLENLQDFFFLFLRVKITWKSLENGWKDSLIIFVIKSTNVREGKGSKKNTKRHVKITKHKNF